ncbi:hypothetical protein F4802DRAFT_341414 [Xylaria palmicola]|nr:hypothetical protein F4802DRAFT_341414 [Xylaria palmicola]
MANPNFRARVDEEDPAQPPVSPWSCFPCRRRKIRCDRRYPCSHCLKGNLDCGFPVSGRTPTRRHDLPSFSSRKEKQDDLLVRLRRLEGFVAKLGTSPEGASLRESTGALSLPSDVLQKGLGATHGQRTMSDIAHVTHELGTLVVHDNESLYVGSWLWGVICDEVKHIRQAIEDDDIESESLEKRILSPSIQGVPFFWGPTNIPDESLQPLPSQVAYIWEVYVENVDPFIKVLHVPTITRAIKEAKGKFNIMGRGMEALMFAVSLAAVTSLRENEVEENFGEDRQTLLARLRLGTEQALSRAGVLNTTDISTIQAFIVYQEIVQQHNGQRATWTLTGLLIRIAVGMGLHRDGSHFSNVSPFDAEIRRRVWYHICFLDARVGDCQVFNVGIRDNMFDTQQPSNFNDIDITPDMVSLPAPKDGCTESTLCVLRCKLWHFAHKFRSSITVEPFSNEASTAYRLEVLTEIRKSIAVDIKQYLKPDETHFHLLIETIIALELSRFGQIIHVANNFKSPHVGDKPHRAFALAMANLEHIFRFAEQPSTAQWGWYLYGCIQWHTMSTILVCLSTSPWGAMSETAWGLAKKAFVHLFEGMTRDPVRQPLPDLIKSVAKQRERQLQELRASPTSAQTLSWVGVIVTPLSRVRDFSDGQETFDTAEAEERLSLEMETSTTLSEAVASNSSQSFNGSRQEWSDAWVDFASPLERTDGTGSETQVSQSMHAYDDTTLNGTSDQGPGVLSSSHQHEGSPFGQVWGQNINPYALNNGEDLGWLEWDSILGADDVL